MSDLFKNSPHPFHSQQLGQKGHLVRGRTRFPRPASQSSKPSDVAHFYTTSKRGYDFATWEMPAVLETHSEVTLVGPSRCRRRWGPKTPPSPIPNQPPGMPCCSINADTMAQTYEINSRGGGEASDKVYVLLDSLPNDIAEAADLVTMERLMVDWMDSLFPDDTFSDVEVIYTRDWAKHCRININDSHDTCYHTCCKYAEDFYLGDYEPDEINVPYGNYQQYLRFRCDMSHAFDWDSPNTNWMTVQLLYYLAQYAERGHRIRVQGQVSLAAWWRSRFPKSIPWKHAVTQQFLDKDGNGVVPYCIQIQPISSVKNRATCNITQMQNYSDGRVEFQVEAGIDAEEEIGYDWIALVPSGASQFKAGRVRNTLDTEEDQFGNPRDVLCEDDKLLPILNRAITLYDLDRTLGSISPSMHGETLASWYTLADSTAELAERLSCLAVPHGLGELLEHGGLDKSSLYMRFMTSLRKDQLAIVKSLVSRDKEPGLEPPPLMRNASAGFLEQHPRHRQSGTYDPFSTSLGQ